MVELLLPSPRKVVMPRELTANPDGKVTTPDGNGGKETIGTWTTRNGLLTITTISRNRDAVLAYDTIWLDGAEYVGDILVNNHEIICLPVAGRAVSYERIPKN